MDEVWARSCNLVVHLPGRSNEAAAPTGSQIASKETYDVGHGVSMEWLDPDISMYSRALLGGVAAYFVCTVLQVSVIAILHDMHWINC